MGVQPRPIDGVYCAMRRNRPPALWLFDTVRAPWGLRKLLCIRCLTSGQKALYRSRVLSPETLRMLSIAAAGAYFLEIGICSFIGLDASFIS
jgi:hypothetical protein